MSRCYNIATSALANSAEGPGHSKRFNSSSPPSFLSAKTLQHCKHTGLNQAYFTRSLIINTSFVSWPGVNFIRKKARVCGSIASLLYAVCLYRAYWHWTLSLHMYIMNSCLYVLGPSLAHVIVAPVDSSCHCYHPVSPYNA